MLRHRRKLCRTPRGDLDFRSRSRTEVGRYRPGRDGRAPARGDRRAARRSLDGSSHQNRADRPASGPLRPQRRVAALRPRGSQPHRLLPDGLRGGTHRHGAHDSRHSSHRRVHRQRKLRMAHPRGEGLSRNQAPSPPAEPSFTPQPPNSTPRAARSPSISTATYLPSRRTRSTC